MNKTILIIGGYGQVGHRVATRLAGRCDSPIIIAGHRQERAAAFAAQLGHHASARMIDVADAGTYDAALDGVDVVLACADLPDAGLVERCLAHGIHYVDLTGEYPLMKQILALDPTARQSKTTAVISVGLMPGLSNLLVRHAVQKIPAAKRIETALLIGLGEAHGAAGVYWTFGHLGDKDFTGKAKFDFRSPYGQRTTLRYAFPDQYTLPQTLSIDSATSWLCVGSALMTNFMALLRQLRIALIFKNPSVMKRFASLAQQIRFGSEGMVLTTRAAGLDGRPYQAWLSGKGEACVTAQVAAEVVYRVATTVLPSGVYHIEQLFGLDDFLPLLKNEGLSFEEAMPN